MGCEDRGKQVFVTTVHCKGNVVAKKDISMINITVNRSLMMELKCLKDLQHSHLARFVGACLDQGKVILEKQIKEVENLKSQKTPFFSLSIVLEDPFKIF
jgi:hypothetical protein